MIGTFGHIVFETSTDRVFTFAGLTRKGSAAFAEHPVLDDKAVLQHVGSGLDTVDFSIRLDAAWGVNPVVDIEKLREIMVAGDEQTLIIGGNVLGEFVLVDLEETWDRVDNRGTVLVAGVSLSLKECNNGVN